MVEDDSYIAGISGVEMVRFVARLSGLPSIEGLRRAHEILDFCGIEQERYRNVETYSTGMRQKLKFAQAIVHDPPLLVLDEPTSGLDPEERQRMLSRIRVLAAQGKTVLLSTHILPDVQTVCDNVVIIVNGRIRLTEKLEVLSRPVSPAFLVRVVGTPDALVQRIQREGIDVKVADNGVITLPLSNDRMVANVWQWAEEADVGIRSLVPSKNSLEQIFIDAVREGKSAHS
jgi:ABC-2 type transport system ATP-binding protein